MSLIQEALKRQQAEFGDGTSKPPPSATMPESAPPADSVTASKAPPPSVMVDDTPPPRPSVPLPEEPLPEPPAAAPARGARPVLSLVGIILFALLFIGAVSWLAGFAWRHFAADAGVGIPVAEPTGVSDQNAPVAEPEMVAVSPAVPVAAEVEITQVPSPASAPLPETPPVPAPATPAPAVVPVQKTAVTPSAAKIASVPARPAAPPPAVKTAPPPAAPWPMLQLTGVLCSAVPGEGAARINNTMIFAGSQIDGVTLVKIQEDGVLLRYQNETRFLRVGATMY